MRILYINPNSTGHMTDGILAVAQAAVPEVEVMGWTNTEGPAAIQGPQDMRVRASGLGVLEVEAAGAAALRRLGDELRAAETEDGVTAVILGCAGMAGLRADLQSQTGLHLIDGVAGAARLAVAVGR